jgi:predicted ATPase
LRHRIELREAAQRLELVDERIEYAERDSLYRDTRTPFFYRFNRGRPVIADHLGAGKKLATDDVARDESILSQRKDPDAYPELTHLGRVYQGIRLYREWSLGRRTVFRQPQRADLRTDRLEEDLSNLAMVLNRFSSFPQARDLLVERLRDVYDGVDDYFVRVEGGTVQLYFREGEFTIPAARMSDGALRYLCLLAILCDPDPPPLLAIEQPELGLHPDLHHKIADLLVSASRRAQIVVTTHSDMVVDALTEYPEAIVVCEKHDGQTTMQRLDASDLAPWLERYRLGQLWTKGEIGGVRW